MLLLVTSAASAQDGDALVARGQRLFEERGCYGCHAIAGTGGKTAPDLSNVGHRYSRGYLTYWLRETPPRGRIEHMPRIQLTESELQALAAYLSSLRGF
jgi:mono/diheme cytochrome c family protein